MSNTINSIEIGLAKVAISNLRYMNNFKKQAVSKLLENPQVPAVKNPGLPIANINTGRIINIRV